MKIDETLLEVIEELIQRKKEAKLVPYHALYRDVVAVIQGSLKRLENSGKITSGKTLNGRWFDVVK